MRKEQLTQDIYRAFCRTFCREVPRERVEIDPHHTRAISRGKEDAHTAQVHDGRWLDYIRTGSRHPTSTESTYAERLSHGSILGIDGVCSMLCVKDCTSRRGVLRITPSRATFLGTQGSF